ncbi:MAG: hypothetical protein KKD33_03250, partial [Verrucomicrobia bacterium]|nr:hypothetical protein [Verrucomicrobiota bacterium]
DPFLATYKYVKKPHTTRLKATRYETEPLLGQVADHVSLQTEVSREGETVSTVTYFVKNASGQYLALALPKNARLWSTRLVEPDGKRSELAALQGDDGLLVPIPRPRDLNTPIQIEMVYAQNHGRLGFFFHRIRLAAPAVLKTPIPFTQWTVQLPAKLAAVGSSGNVVSDHGTRMNGLGTVLLAVTRVVQTLVQKATAWCLFGVIVLALACLVSWLTGRWRPTLGTLIAGSIVLILPVLIWLPAWLPVLSALKNAFNAASQNLQQLSFTRSVSLPDDPSLFLVLNLVPSWVGSAGSLWLLLIAGLLGGGAMIRSLRREHFSAMGLALGLTLLTVALAQLTLGRVTLALGILVILLVVVAGIPLKFAVQAGRKRKQARAWADGADLPPFQPAAPISPAMTPQVVVPTATEPAVPPPSEAGPNGYICLPLLTAIGLMALGLSALAVFSAPSYAPSSWRPMSTAGLTIQTVDAVITGPGTGRDAEKSAQVIMTLDFETTQPATSLVLSAACVLTEFKTDAPRRVSLLSTPAGYALNINRDGDYQATLTFQAPVRETNGQWVISFDLPAHLKNHVVLKLPESGLDIQSDEAVYIKTIESSTQTEAVALFEPAGHVRLTWRPKMRKTELEKTVFFCEVNSLVTFDPGVINGLHLVRYQIAQGEIKTLALSIPEQMNVTSASAPGLSTWRFDPATRSLEAILQKPASGSLVLILVTQTPREGLPYAAVIGAPQGKEAVRQRGALALAAPETVQIVGEPQEGLNAMNISDFAPDLIAAKGAAAAPADHGGRGDGRAPGAAQPCGLNHAPRRGRNGSGDTAGAAASRRPGSRTAAAGRGSHV